MAKGFDDAAAAQTKSETKAVGAPETRTVKEDTNKAKPRSLRKVSPEIKAMNRIEAILEELDPQSAARVARYAGEKASQRLRESFDGIPILKSDL